MARYAIAIDIGGTFTDVTLADLNSGRLWVTKTPTTPSDPSEGFLIGIEKALNISGVRSDELSYIFHGTTTATNTILENRGAKTALLTTKGFKYVLEIGRHDIPRGGNMFSWQKPPRPVPAALIFEISERQSVYGEELEPLDETTVQAASRQLKRLGVESVAICFVHSYANPTHERRVRGIIERENPDCYISISSDILPVFREYERSMATALNAFVQPVVGRYLGRLEDRLSDQHIQTPLWIMKSNGGVISADVSSRQPIQTVLSGPAAGVIGAQAIGKIAGFTDVISVDIGGTSADVCLIRQGEAEVTNEGSVGTWPLRVPMIDINTIGAGGGSIAQVTKEGTLTVGPHSAGAVPGPACYGVGNEPTVTDANLVLGRIPPHLLGGEILLDVERARSAIEQHVAHPLGLDLETAAQGILDIVNNNMFGAIRLVSVERGHDPREFALIPFGGAGPLHGGDLAKLLNMRTVIIPRNPGVLSTFGLLTTDLRNDYARTSLQQPPHYDYDGMMLIYQSLEQQAIAWLDHEGVPPDDRYLHRLADLRYRHQGFEITVPWGDVEINSESVERLIERFHRRHEQLYTFAQEDLPVEIVTLRVSATGVLPKLTILTSDSTSGTAERAVTGSRRVYFRETGGYVDCPLYDREALPVHAAFGGPAIVEQLDSTAIVLPGQEAHVDRYGDLVITNTPDERVEIAITSTLPEPQL